MLQEIGFPIERSAEEAWPDFHGWRVNYETVAYRLADKLVVPPAPWSARGATSGPASRNRDAPLTAVRPAALRPSPHGPFLSGLKPWPSDASGAGAAPDQSSASSRKDDGTTGASTPR